MPNEDKDKLEKVLEAYKPIPMKRMFYPRGFKLSDSFIDSFHQEYDRLVGEGLNPKSLMERLSKALRFHVNEKRRYTQPVVEGGTSNIDKTGSEGKDWSKYKSAHKKAAESGHKPGTKEYAAAYKDAGGPQTPSVVQGR